MWWEITLLYFFSWNCTWFGQKEPIKVQNFRLSTAHVKFHQICTLIGSLKYKILAKKYRGVISHDPEDWCKLWRKTDVSKMTGIWWNLTRALKGLQNLHFYLLLLCKVFNIWPKKVTVELSFTARKGDAKFEEKLNCGLENGMRNMANFHQRTWKSQNWNSDRIL